MEKYTPAAPEKPTAANPQVLGCLNDFLSRLDNARPTQNGNYQDDCPLCGGRLIVGPTERNTVIWCCFGEPPCNSDDVYNALAAREPHPLPDSEEEDNDSPQKGKSAAKRLVAIGRQAERFHYPQEDKAFARIAVNGHQEIWPLRSRAFRQWLGGLFYAQYDQVPNSQAIEDALSILEGDARFSGAERTLSVRVARDEEENIWIDLADAEWRAVCVTPDGWHVISDPPPMFRRHAPTQAQVLPMKGGSLQLLRDFLNVRDEQGWTLLVAWLVAALIPEIAHAVLVVHGEQGSAKSTLVRCLSLLIDPSHTPLRTEPRDTSEWVQAASHSWLVTLDNVSTLHGWLSDALCRAVSGDGFTKRKLYTDEEDIVISFRRVLALTGIEQIAQRADLLDRSILLALMPFPPNRRRPESEILPKFLAARPLIFGTLLDTLSSVLRVLPDIHLDNLPRMADFARVGVAVERVLGWPEGTFLDAYTANVAAQHEEALAASLVADALRIFMEKQDTWTGITTELLKHLATRSPSASQREWPKNPRGLAGQLKRIAPNLRAIGIYIAHHREAGTGRRLITLSKTPLDDEPNPPSQPSQSSTPPQTAWTFTPEPSPLPEEPSQGFASQSDACDDCDDAFPADWEERLAAPASGDNDPFDDAAGLSDRDAPEENDTHAEDFPAAWFDAPAVTPTPANQLDAMFRE